MPLSSTSIVKIIVVTDDLEKTVSAYRTLLGTGQGPNESNESHKMVRKPYTKYRGEEITDTPMKAESVFTDNFWFEIIQPLGNHDPWAAWLKDHGTSVYSICLLSESSLENDEKMMEESGFVSIFKQEKGYEAYEYFDTSQALGVLTEIKERYN